MPAKTVDFQLLNMTYHHDFHFVPWSAAPGTELYRIVFQDSCSVRYTAFVPLSAVNGNDLAASRARIRFERTAYPASPVPIPAGIADEAADWLLLIVNLCVFETEE